MNYFVIDKMERTHNFSMSNFHSHSHYEIYILSQGERAVFSSNDLYQVVAPAMLVIPPHVIHKTEGLPYERYNINIIPAFLRETELKDLNELALSLISFSSQDFSFISSLLTLMQELQSKPSTTEQDEEHIHSLLGVLLFFVNHMSRIRKTPPSTRNDMPILLLNIINYLKHHFAERITLDSLATLFFTSKSTIIYNFKTFLKCSPIDYLLKIRLTEAKKLLLAERKKSMEEIAEHCGFSSANYFAEIFKSKEGLSPSNYRKFRF